LLIGLKVEDFFGADGIAVLGSIQAHLTGGMSAEIEPRR